MRVDVWQNGSAEAVVTLQGEDIQPCRLSCGAEGKVNGIAVVDDLEGEAVPEWPLRSSPSATALCIWGSWGYSGEYLGFRLSFTSSTTSH
jgi:hypothetical protein